MARPLRSRPRRPGPALRGAALRGRGFWFRRRCRFGVRAPLRRASIPAPEPIRTGVASDGADSCGRIRPEALSREASALRCSRCGVEAGGASTPVRASRARRSCSLGAARRCRARSCLTVLPGKAWAATSASTPVSTMLPAISQRLTRLQLAQRGVAGVGGVVSAWGRVSSVVVVEQAVRSVSQGPNSGIDEDREHDARPTSAPASASTRPARPGTSRLRGAPSARSPRAARRAARQVGEHVQRGEREPHEEADLVDRQQRRARARADEQQRDAAGEHDDRGDHDHRREHAQRRRRRALAPVGGVVRCSSGRSGSRCSRASAPRARSAACRRTGAPTAAGACAGSSRRSPPAARAARRRWRRQALVAGRCRRPVRRSRGASAVRVGARARSWCATVDLPCGRVCGR